MLSPIEPETLPLLRSARRLMVSGSLSGGVDVDVPHTLHDYSQGPRVIVTEWVYGRHLDQLDRAEGLRMTYMAVEACTASLVVTGVVHADPHEGNLMLAVTTLGPEPSTSTHAPSHRSSDV